MNDRAWAVFGLLILQAILVGAICLWCDPTVGDAKQHSNHKDMLRAHPQAQRGGMTVLLGGLLGGAEVLTFGAFLFLAGRNNRGQSKWRSLPPFAAGSFVLLVVFAAMILTYWQGLSESAPAFWGPFPVPTTIMIGGLWLAPWVFVLLFVLRFDRMAVSEDELTQFRAAIHAYRKTGRR